MAFALYVSNGTTTTYLSDGSPFKFESLEGISNAPTVRFEQRGPLQHGATDLGYRLGPRVLQLSLVFTATTDAQLDSYREQLMDAFAPSDIALRLYYERDDGTTRTLDVHAVGDLAIELTPELRPGHTHRAKLQLRAANPLWVDQSVVLNSYSTEEFWYLAGGTIDADDVLMYGANPTQGQAWTYSGTGGNPNPLTIAFRSSQESLSGTTFAYHRTGSSNAVYAFGVNGTAYAIWTQGGTAHNIGSAAMAAGTHNYFHRYDGVLTNTFNRGTPVIAQFNVFQLLDDGAGRLRSHANNSPASYWSNSLEKYALYSAELTDEQLEALDMCMTGTIGFDSATINAVNDGDVPAYPVIRLTGPLSNITITNSTTGDSFSLGTIAIGSGDIYTIDLRNGRKRVYDLDGFNRLGYVTNPADLAGFRLEPNPIAAGGTNTITVAGTASAASSRVAIEHYNQYVSF